MTYNVLPFLLSPEVAIFFSITSAATHGEGARV